MSSLSFMPASILLTAAGQRFNAKGVPHFSSSSRRMDSALVHKNTPLTVANCLRENSKLRDHELNPTVDMEKWMKMLMRDAEKQIPQVPHWRFCYTILCQESVIGAFIIHQLDLDLRNAVCVFHFMLRALDTVEDDTSIAAEVKVPILMAFHRYMYDREWQFACGTENHRVLMDKFHHGSTAFQELKSSYQEVIEDVTRRMGAGMAKFICKEVETIDDYDEYCHYVAGLVGLGLSRLFHASGVEDLPPSTFFHSTSVFLQKADIIEDYLEDINEIPKSRMFWPRQIWSKYVDRLEDLQYEKNMVKALHCLNDMVTNALLHAEDCLKDIGAIRDPAIFRLFAMLLLITMGTLASCYNNIQVFRGVKTLRRDLAAKFVDRINTISDFYQAFYDYVCMLKSKIDDNDPNATKTKERVEAILKTLQGRQNVITKGICT